jgi:hypothetical protein
MVLMLSAVGQVGTASAQPAFTGRSPGAIVPDETGQRGGARHGELVGIVTDDHQRPLGGVIVSAIGVINAFSLTDLTGRYVFKSLPPGPYFLRAHLQGYTPARTALIQVSGGGSASYAITMTRRGAGKVLSAGVGPDAGSGDGMETSPADGDSHSELAWRLRHLRRGVLNDTDGTIVGLHDEASGPALGTMRRAVMNASSRVASAVLPDLPVSGQLNLLSTASLDHPQRLFTMDDGTSHEVAYLSLTSPGARGDWAFRGALTQGDLSSWVVSGSYARHTDAAHVYEAGMAYTMQRYAGDNAAALAAFAYGSRTAGDMFVDDQWQVLPSVKLNYGAKYARYGYLENEGLLSPRAAVTVSANDTFRIRVAASRLEIAPGAEEFQPPSSTMGLWLPPERTFSTLVPGREFAPERVTHYEISTEQDVAGGIVVGGRVFRQRVGDQIMTLFDLSLPGNQVPSSHYYVASAGDVDAQGWSLSVGRTIGTVRGSIDYTDARANWTRRSLDADLLSALARPFVPGDRERVRNVTSMVDAELPVTATHMVVLYRINTSVGSSDTTTNTVGSRFDVEINQQLPFLRFTNAQWAMLVVVRNVFHDNLADGSVYDELLVMHPPKRIVGGVTVRF